MKSALPVLLPLLAAPAQEAPVDGAPGIGDPYFPELGNGGYDVQHYALALDVDPRANRLEGVATIDAVALVALRSFHLDLEGLVVASVTVDGQPAEFSHAGPELAVTPREPLEAGARFRAAVTYSGSPKPIPVAGIPVAGIGWLHFEDRIFTLSEPCGARSWYPVNDHPRDKATYAMTVTVPAPYVAAANGVLTSRTEQQDRRTFTFAARDPMASYLATLNVAPFRVEQREGPGGLPLTFYAPADGPPEALADFARTGEMIEVLSQWFGPYPFECYGGVVADAGIRAALETQTLPVYGGGRADESTQVHELAHQWFGNSVSVDLWRDLWLAESFASYATWLWTEREHGREELDRRLRRGYPQLCRIGTAPVLDPGAERMFGAGVYFRGPIAIHALRLELGDEAFFALLHRWTERFRGASGGTQDFVALASEVAGRDLAAFFAGWLSAPEIPDIPQAALSCAEPTPTDAGAPAERAGREGG